ncbi:hypothetical protein AAC387_Pa01g1905 [Persea americana]
MTRSEAIEAVDPCAKEMELKEELQRLVRGICGEGESRIEAFDLASKTLWALKDLKLKRSTSSRRRDSVVPVPEHFLCPISSELMKDPVVLATGQTYDRPFIQAWLNAGHRTCPRTQQVLSHSILTPNHLIQNMISKWCEDHGVELPSSVLNSEKEGLTQKEQIHLSSLLEKISVPSISEQKEAAKELRSLTKRMPSFRVLLGETPNAIPQLLSLLSRKDLDCHPEVKEDVVTTILNLSINDNNKKTLAENPQAIPLLMDALKTGSMETRRNSAAALFSLSALDCNKIKIGELGAMKPLVDLLEHGNSIARKDAASAIFNLCMVHENKTRAVRDGAVRVALKTIINQSLIDESLAILAILSSNQQAVEEMGRCGAVTCLLSIIRESTCGRNGENSVAILYSICIYDRTKLREIREEENSNGTLSRLALNGTSRARRKAAGILERLNRIIHTA